VTELAVIRARSVRSWDWLEETMADVTAAPANWWPLGTAARSPASRGLQGGTGWTESELFRSVVAPVTRDGG